jgi:hypothetical protein
MNTSLLLANIERTIGITTEQQKMTEDGLNRLRELLIQAQPEFLDASTGRMAEAITAIVTAMDLDCQRLTRLEWKAVFMYLLELVDKTQERNR